jgi:hypothetical protein
MTLRVQWPDERQAIALLKAQAKLATRVSVQPWVLDHIVPLNHPYVSGLHCVANLRIVTQAFNSYKSNRFNPDQLDLGI